MIEAKVWIRQRKRKRGRYTWIEKERRVSAWLPSDFPDTDKVLILAPEELEAYLKANREARLKAIRETIIPKVRWAEIAFRGSYKAICPFCGEFKSLGAILTLEHEPGTFTIERVRICSDCFERYAREIRHRPGA